MTLLWLTNNNQANRHNATTKSKIPNSKSPMHIGGNAQKVAGSLVATL